MYIKYKMLSESAAPSNSFATNGQHALSKMMSDIQKVLKGVTTSTSEFFDVCDIESSSITGTIPNSSSIYMIEQDAGWDNDGNYGAQHKISKRHYSTVESTDATYNPYVTINNYFSGTYGWKMRMSTSDGSNIQSSTVGGWNDNNTQPYNQIMTVHDGVFHFFISDKHFIMSHTVPDTLSVTSNPTWCYALIDQEYSPIHDEKLYSTNPLWCPTVEIITRFGNLDTNSTGSDQDFISIYKAQFVGQDGSSHNCSIEIMSSWVYWNFCYGSKEWLLYWGQYNSSQGNQILGTYYGERNDGSNIIPTIFPSPSTGITSQSADAGSTAHKLHPVYYEPYSRGSSINKPSHDAKWGRLENIYRTSDAILQTGDILTDGTNNFRILRLHKTGGPLYNQVDNTLINIGTAEHSACYAIPE